MRHPARQASLATAFIALTLSLLYQYLQLSQSAEARRHGSSHASASNRPAKQIFEYPGMRSGFSSALKAYATPAYVVAASGTNRGVLLKQVESYGFAQAFGLSEGDVLLSINQHVVQTPADADRILYAAPKGKVQVMFVHPTDGGLQLYNAPIPFNGASPDADAQALAAAQSESSSNQPATGGRRQPPMPSAASIQQTEAYVIDLINHDRRENGVPSSLPADDNLTRLARGYAQEMAQKKFFGHITPDGRDPQMRASQAGIQCGVFENISWELSDDSLPNKARMCQGRMMAEPPNKQNHRSNILDPNHQCVGVGIAVGPEGKFYMVQEFAHGRP
jgi:uncharacterized protein YkwD